MRIFPGRLFLLLLLALCDASEAAAQALGNPPTWCRNGAFADDSEVFRLARVAGEPNERVHFYGDEEGCPKMNAQCRKKSYVIPGDELIVSRTYGDWACVWFQPRKGYETVGWIPARQLNINGPVGPPPLSGWLGEWEFHDNFVKFSRDRQGWIHMTGQAYWRGLGDNVHVGELGSRVKPAAGGSLVLEADICVVESRLVGPYLLVNDNGQCGGVNVTFDGVYRKKPARQPAKASGRKSN